MSSLRKLGSVVAADSWGETLSQRVRIQRVQKNAESKCDPRWFQRSLAGDHTLHPSGTAERRTLRQWVFRELNCARKRTMERQGE